jgi:hypothetical protein
MGVSQRSDQVFQLSLTEIAFTIAFILLLLLGYLVVRESDAKKKAEEALLRVQDLGTAQQAFDQASTRLKEELTAAGAIQPDEIISRLTADARAAAERDRLQVRIKDLEAQISALAEVKQTVANAAKEAGKKETVDRVVAALALQAEAEKAIESAKSGASAAVSQPASAPTPATSAAAVFAHGKSASEGNKGPAQSRPSAEETRAEVQRSLQVTAAVDRALRDAGAKLLPAGKEAETVAEMVRAAQTMRGLESSGIGVQDVFKENMNLRGQLAFMRNQLTAASVGRGLDHLPCWTDGNKKIEYLFNIELKPGLVVVTPAWPEHRREDAAKLPNVSELMAGPVSFERFRTAVRPILDLSKRQDPECRHYVIINNAIETRRDADPARWMVEEFFYKLEAKK